MAGTTGTKRPPRPFAMPAVLVAAAGIGIAALVAIGPSGAAPRTAAQVPPPGGAEPPEDRGAADSASDDDLHRSLRAACERTGCDAAVISAALVASVGAMSAAELSDALGDLGREIAGIERALDGASRRGDGATVETLRRQLAAETAIARLHRSAAMRRGGSS